RGKIVSIRYVKADFADGVDFVLTGETSGQTIWSEEAVNASATRYPRAPTHSTAGIAPLYASGGMAVNDMIALAVERIKIVVVPSDAQLFVEWRPERLGYPIVGYLVYRWEQHGIIVDLKTTEKLPSSVKIPHAR